MRVLLFFILLFGVLHAQEDYSNMFFTPEPFNAYSEDAYVDKEAQKKKKKPSKIKVLLQKGGDTYYAFMLGLQNQKEYDRFGYALSASMTKLFPKLLKNAPGLFFEGDAILNLKALKDSNGLLDDARYSYLGLYAGYMYKSSEKTAFKARAGFAYGLKPLNAFKFSYGLSVIRTLKTDRYKLIADLSFMQNVWHLSAGARFKLQSE